MSSVIIFFIRIYQTLLSPEKSVWVKWGIVRERKTCVFYPTCSGYMILAIKKYGVRKGIKKGLNRIKRCIPQTPPSVDMP
ncbi:MAG: membrane protein insertion efficiency factor YidD [Parcubacteria group bacterium]|nr:membrane protein insertion efficiency factor YidD [Parcubacteria group bacterium]